MHFYDHTAYNYIQAVSEDFGMRHIQGLCSEMEDLKNKRGRSQLRYFQADFELDGPWQKCEDGDLLVACMEREEDE